MVSSLDPRVRASSKLLKLYLKTISSLSCGSEKKNRFLHGFIRLKSVLGIWIRIRFDLDLCY
jgi:hypothetical protein